MPRITIGTQVIDFPNSGRDASWSQGVIEFAQATADQLAAISGAFDIGSRVQTLTANANSNLDIDGAIFPSGSVRSFTFNYAIYRSNGASAFIEQGTVAGLFNTLTSTWTLEQEFSGDRQADGTKYNTFGMSGDQLQLSTVAITGSYDSTSSKISYSASTQLVSS